MARARSTPSAELPHDPARIFGDLADFYGPFPGQVAVFAHVPVSGAQLVELTLPATLWGFFHRFNGALRIEEEDKARAALAAL